MKLKVLAFLISSATCLVTLNKGRNIVESMNLEVDKLHQFSGLLPKYMAFPFMYDLKVKMLSKEDALLFQKYAETLSPYLWIAFFALVISIVTLITILMTLFKKIAKVILKRYPYKKKIIE